MGRLRLLVGLLCGGLMFGMVIPAAAEPATSVSYPGSATATRFTGLAFDTCTAPTVAQMTAWKASPYKAIGIYFGGVNRGCTQPQLTASWVSTVTRMGWRLIPIYMGYQAPCTTRVNAVKMTVPSAATQGTSQAADAVAKAAAIGLLPGSAIYGDMEHYNASDATCRATVLRYLSSWTKEPIAGATSPRCTPTRTRVLATWQRSTTQPPTRVRTRSGSPGGTWTPH